MRGRVGNKQIRGRMSWHPVRLTMGSSLPLFVAREVVCSVIGPCYVTTDFAQLLLQAGEVNCLCHWYTILPACCSCMLVEESIDRTMLTPSYVERAGEYRIRRTMLSATPRCRSLIAVLLRET